MSRTDAEDDLFAEKARRFSIGAGVATLGVCCAVKVLFLSSLAFSGAATTARAWARVALVVLAVLAGVGASLLARWRRACAARALAADEAVRAERGAPADRASTSADAEEALSAGSGAARR